MKRIIILVVFVFLNLTYFSYAQEKTISLHINDLFIYTYDDRQETSYSFELGGEYSNKKRTLFHYKMGYKQYKSSETPILYRSGNRSAELELISTYLDYSLTLGIGKLIDNELLKFKYGVDLRSTYMPGGENIFNIVYKTKGNITDIEKRLTLQPDKYNIDLNFFSIVHYTFYKRFAVGIEMINGLYYSIEKGTTISTYEHFNDKGNLLNSNYDEQFNSKKIISSSIGNTSIVLSYTF